MPRKSASKRSASKGSAKHRTGKKRSGKKAGPQADSTQRLQRLLASAGFGSRRQCEELIEAGRVDVDGVVVTKLGTTVDPSENKVRVDGVLLIKQKLVYFAVNKPIGFVTTNRDPQGRPRVVDLVPPDERVFPVGRLDRNSEGLILLTNDGELAQKLTHPKFGVRKVYRVTVAGKVDTETMRQMRKGVYIAEGFVRVEGAKLLKSRSRSTEMEIVLREGKNREIRRILARLGHKVQHLRRIAIGPLRLGDVPPGAYRVLSHQEVDKLWQATETSSDPQAKQHARKKQSGTKDAGKKFAGKRHANKSSRGPDKKTSGSRRPARQDAKPTGEFAFEESQTIGSVIGADATPATQAPQRKSSPRRTKSAKGKRKGRTTGSRSTVRKSSKKTAGGNKSKPITGKRAGTKRGTKRKRFR